MDGVIQPVAATTAVREGEFHYYGYSAVANVLDFPAAAFPVDVDSGQSNDSVLQGRSLNAVDNLVRTCCTFGLSPGRCVPINEICRSPGRRDRDACGTASRWPATSRGTGLGHGAGHHKRLVCVWPCSYVADVGCDVMRYSSERDRLLPREILQACFLGIPRILQLPTTLRATWLSEDGYSPSERSCHQSPGLVNCPSANLPETLLDVQPANLLKPSEYPRTRLNVL